MTSTPTVTTAPAARVAGLQRASALLFVLAAAASFLLSVTLWFSGNEQQGIFVGLWVPSILALGGLLRPLGDQR